MKNKNIIGIMLIVLGAIFLLNKLEVFSFNIFFDGWWTLFLIIPALLSMSKQGVTTGNTILLLLGGLFLLKENGLDFKGLLVPIVLIILGVSLFMQK
jgi:hypothetical protein